MNEIQKYLNLVAQTAVRKAAGDLIANTTIDANLIADCLNEYINKTGIEGTPFESEIDTKMTFAGGLHGGADYSKGPLFLEPIIKDGENRCVGYDFSRALSLNNYYKNN